MIAWGLLKNGQYSNEKWATFHGINEQLTVEDCDADWTNCQEELNTFTKSNDPLLQSQLASKQTQRCLIYRNALTPVRFQDFRTHRTAHDNSQNWPTFNGVRQKVSHIETTTAIKNPVKSTPLTTMPTTTKPTTTTTKPTTTTTKPRTTTIKHTTTTTKPTAKITRPTMPSTTTKTTSTTISSTTTKATTITE
ncbi:Uncharacterized protein APZ42_014031 [Daphnia magna]|uniref:Uncharacterized protein n=1 Tax=Daphnia magna TaxID=35525 RepID=A0A162QAC4_9CRUS|nr:Uncharacterized protein APZ42_014031 [Daphnia magna]